MEHKKTQRSQEGARAGILGLGCNVALASAKFFIGMASGSVAIMADGANNLTDSVSALLTILGFRMEERGEDEVHPYGHGRIEYVTGFLISLLILGTGITVGKEAAVSILYPKPVSGSALTVGVLVLSVLVKLGMMLYYGAKNKQMKSPALEAVRKDSLNDAGVSALALAGILLMPYCSLPLDGILGIIMALYIFLSGMKSFLENLTLLLGEGPGWKLENELRQVLSGYPGIESVEEITVHDYGPDKKVAVAEINFAKSCDREEKRRIAGCVVQLCKDTMNVELSLYSPLY